MGFIWAMIIGALFFGIVSRLYEFVDIGLEARGRPDERFYPTHEVTDRKPIQSFGIQKEGEIHPGYIRYHDGMIVNNYTGQVIWPNQDGTYNWKDDLFPRELEEKLKLITS